MFIWFINFVKVLQKRNKLEKLKNINDVHRFSDWMIHLKKVEYLVLKNVKINIQFKTRYLGVVDQQVNNGHWEFIVADYKI